MHHKTLAIITVIAISAIMCGIIIYQALHISNPPPIGIENSTFNLIFRYGVGAKNELNTYNCTFTKDLVINGTVTTNLTLTPEELTGLRQKIAELGIWNYPDSYALHPFMHSDPQCEWQLKIQINDKTKQMSWNSNSLIESNIRENLTQISDYIIALVELKPEYLALPDAEGGYL